MYADYENLVNTLARDDSEQITFDDVHSAIHLAVSRYSKDRPLLSIKDVVSTGSHFLPLPEGWVVGFSDVVDLEYPVEQIPAISVANFDIYQAPDGEKIITDTLIAAGEQVRVRFHIFHTVDDEVDTVPFAEREAVASYAASLVLDQLSSLFSGDTDSTIQADSVDHNNKASQYAARARAMRKRYYDELGIDNKRNSAAGVVVDMDFSDSRGRDRLWHAGRYR